MQNKPRTIMIVDDDPALRDALEFSFSSEGLNVRPFADADHVGLGSSPRIAIRRSRRSVFLDRILLIGSIVAVIAGIAGHHALDRRRFEALHFFSNMGITTVQSRKE